MRQWLVDDGIGVIRVVMMIAIVLWPAGCGDRSQAAAPHCQTSGSLVRIAELPEASGVAVSRRSPERLWSHNDSGEAMLVALDTRGAVTGRVQPVWRESRRLGGRSRWRLSRRVVHLHRRHW